MTKLPADPAWTMKDGTRIPYKDMLDNHLANAIRMVARSLHKPSYLGIPHKDSKFKALCEEARRRKFTVTLLSKSITINGREEYADVRVPSSLSKLSPLLSPTDIDSRPQE